MPIPYHNDESLSLLGSAAFLVVKVVSLEPCKCVGSVFIVNAIGEPLEFAYNRVEVIPSVLWTGVHVERAAAARLVSSLFDAVHLTPKLLFILSDSTLSFSSDNLDPVKLDIPTIVVSRATAVCSAPSTVIWGPTPPDDEQTRFYELISSRGLLFEPFERALTALKAIYTDIEDLG